MVEVHEKDKLIFIHYRVKIENLENPCKALVAYFLVLKVMPKVVIERDKNQISVHIYLNPNYG